MFDPVEGCIRFVKDVYECFKSVFTVALRQLYRTVKLLFRAVKNLYTWKDQASVQEEVRDLFDNIEEASTCLEKNSGEDIKTQTSRAMIPVNEGNRNVLRSSKSHYNSNTQNPKCVTA